MHRHRPAIGRSRAAVGQQARQRRAPSSTRRDRQPLGRVAGAARRRAQPGADHAEHDRRDRQVLVAPGVLAEHPLARATAAPAGPSPSAGCTTTSGASSSASTCSGQPSTVRPVPSSQRPRLSSPQSSARRRCCSRGCLAWRRSPARRSLGCRDVDAPTAAAMPSTRSTMTTRDHRSPQRRGVLARGAGSARDRGAYALPGARRRGGPALRAPLGIEDRTRERPRLRAHLRRRPPPRGHPRGARDPRGARRAGDVLPRRRAGRAQPRAGRRDRRGRARDRPALRPPPQPAAPGAAAGARRHRPRAGDASRRRPVARSTLYRPPYGVFNATALRAGARATAGARCCGATGAATGRRARRPSRSRRA